MNINQLLKQAQNMQKKMQKTQEEMEHQEFEGQSGGGMVKATLNGAGKAIKLNIDPSIVTPDDKEMLEDLVLTAINDADSKRRDVVNNNFSDTFGGQLPPGIKMPF